MEQAAQAAQGVQEGQEAPASSASAQPAQPTNQDTYVTPDRDVERCLYASVKVFEFAKKNLESIGDDGVCAITKADLIMLRRYAVAMNNSVTRYVKTTHACEDRLVLELHLIRQIMAREATDRDANRARVFEQFRRFQGDEDGTLAVTAAAAPHNSNPLLAPSQSQVSVDRALASVARIDQSLATLSPTGQVSIHGAGLISAHNVRTAALEALA